MDAYEILVSAIIIGVAIWLSDWLLDALLPKHDTWIDRSSPWLDRFERPTRGA